MKIDLETGETLATITGDWSVIPQQALTVDFKNQEIYIGGWDGDMIWRTDINGVTISTHIFPDVSGLAWQQNGGPDLEGSLWAVEYSSSSTVTELAPDMDWIIIQETQIPGGQPYSGAGADISRVCSYRGHLWLCDKITNTIYLIDLMEPWSTSGREYLPENLIGYNVYRNDGLSFFTDCTDPCWCTRRYYPNLKDSSYFKYEVSALFDLSPYGFPGDTGELLRSDPAELDLSYFNELDFFEEWASGSPNYWELNVNSWKIDQYIGNDAPAAVFRTNPVLYHYEQSLETWQIIKDGIPGDITLEYDVSLSSVNPTGEEKLLTQVYDYVNDTWNTVKSYTNLGGSFDWRRDTLNITPFFNDNHFKIRFNALGENSDDISYWAVDNIAISRICPAPDSIEATLIPAAEDSVLVTWDEPVPPLAEWKQWDDGIPDSGVGFGTSKDSWFYCAIRWTPELLEDLKGARITAIGFIPYDVSADFKIALWSGDDPLPFYTQASRNLSVFEWNNFQLDQPQQIDITKDLYAGYILSTYCEYPISVDNGPALDSLGNMFRFGSGGPWTTLLAVNPEFDWNLNIKAFFERDGVPADSYLLYRSLDGSESTQIAEVEGLQYMDFVEPGYEMACYKLQSYFLGLSECTSDFSEEACVILTSVNRADPDLENYVKIYPNPATDVLYIESAEEIKSVSIFNGLGGRVGRWKSGTVEKRNGGTLKLWNSGTLEQQVAEIPLTDLLPGLYLVRVETAGGVVAGKVVVR